jgi:chitodextrinase
MISPPPAAATPRQWRAIHDVIEMPRNLPRDFRLPTLIGGALIVLSLLIAIVLAAHIGTWNLIYPHPALKLTYAAPSGPVHPSDVIHLSVTPTAGRELRYSWTFGDGATASGTRVTHAYAKYGYYTVTVTATDAIGQRTTERAVVTVVPQPPKAAFSVSHDRVYNYMVSVDGSASSGTDLHYYWDFGDGYANVSGIERRAAHNYMASGAYGVTLTVVDGAGQRATVTIVVPVKMR